jgi:hypothetical protein
MQFDPERRKAVLAKFKERENILYIADAIRKLYPEPGKQKQLVGRLAGSVLRFSSSYGQGGSVLDADPLSVDGNGRGAVARGTSVGEGLRALNRAFLDYYIRAAATQWGALQTEGEISNTRGGAGVANVVGSEPLFYQQFLSDSVFPAGHEGLNEPGALSGTLLDKPFASQLDAGVPVEDRPWSDANPSRTAEQAVAEYYGGSVVGDKMMLGCSSGKGGTGTSLELAQKALMGGGGRPVTNEDVSAAAYRQMTCNQSACKPSLCGWDSYVQPAGRRRGALAEYVAAGRANASGTPAQRYTSIPFWQKGGRRPELFAGRWQSNTEGGGGDVDATLGNGSSETGGEREGVLRGNKTFMQKYKNPRPPAYEGLCTM